MTPVRSGSAAALQQQAQGDDASEPDHAGADRDPVEVALGDGGASETAGDAASEHVREPAAPALVEQDQQDEQQAGQHEQHSQGDNHGGTA